MGKNTKIRLNEKVGQVKFVGQPIFKQVVNLFDGTMNLATRQPMVNFITGMR